MKRFSLFGTLICGVLALIGFFPVANEQSGEASRVFQNQVLIKDLLVALESFKVECGHWPGQSVVSQVADIRLLSTGPFIDCLQGQYAALNPKEIKFIDLLPAKNGKWGYVPAEGANPCRLVDLWGNPYVILLDTNGDMQLQNPDIENSDPAISQSKSRPPPKFLPFETAIFSLGKDQIEGTADDIVSWRSNLEPYSPSPLPWLALVVGSFLFVLFVVNRLQARPDEK